jgi:hypothetical protein
MLGRAAEASMLESYEIVDPKADTTPPGDSPIVPLAAADSARRPLPSPLTLSPRVAVLLPIGRSISIAHSPTTNRHRFFAPTVSVVNNTHEPADPSTADWVLVDPHVARAGKDFGKTA